MSVDEALIGRYLCYTCDTYIEPPIRQCVLGHVFCYECDCKYATCPTCSSDKGEARAFHLENIYPLVQLPCNNKSRGCKFLGRHDVRKAHKKICTFNNCDNAVKYIAQQCKWSGETSNQYRYITEPPTHSENESIFFVTKQFSRIWRLRYKNPPVTISFKGTIKMECKMFVVKFSVCPTAKVKWFIDFATNRYAEDKYNYEISFGDSRKDEVKISGNCGSDSGLELDQLINYCDRDGNFTFCVRLYKASSNGPYRILMP